VVGFLLPYLIYGGLSVAGGLWQVGWLCIALGATLYGLCLFQFLISGGTPAIFFTCHLRFLIGEEPYQLVRNGLYQLSRNPMYLGVVLAVFGQAIVLASVAVAGYGVCPMAFLPSGHRLSRRAAPSQRAWPLLR